MACTTSTFPMRAFFNGGSSTMRDHINTFSGAVPRNFLWWNFLLMMVKAKTRLGILHEYDERQNQVRKYREYPS
jgi:hypothetical protein